MRELKFRVWSQEDKQYRTDCNVCKLFNGKTGCPATIYNDEGDRFDIEQYTGLKDKFGEEIYEGDVVKRLKPHEFLKNAVQTEIFRVRWGVRKAGFFAYSKERKKHNVPAKRLNANDVYEVIGNIHENPELLEGQK